jgi:hypothetical protein
MNTAKVYNMQLARQKQEDPLNLQSLPLVSPARDGWPAVEAALRRDARRRSLARYAAAALAAAATVTLAVGLYWQQPTVEPARPEAADLAGDAARVQAPAPADDTLDALVALSQRLEGRLRHIRTEVGRLPANAVVYQVELEDLVVQVTRNPAVSRTRSVEPTGRPAAGPRTLVRKQLATRIRPDRVSVSGPICQDTQT